MTASGTVEYLQSTSFQVPILKELHFAAVGKNHFILLVEKILFHLCQRHLFLWEIFLYICLCLSGQLVETNRTVIVRANARTYGKQAN